MRNLIWLIHLIYSLDKKAKIVISGDFNWDHVPTKLIERYKL